MNELSPETISAQEAVKHMLGYYINSLVMDNVEDPRRHAAEMLGNVIGLSEEQVRFVMMSAQKESANVKESFKMVLELLEMVDGKNTDKDIQDILQTAIKLVSKISDLYNASLSSYGQEENNDRQDT